MAASIASVDGFAPNTLELSWRARNDIDNKDITDLVRRIDIVFDGLCVSHEAQLSPARYSDPLVLRPAPCVRLPETTRSLCTERAIRRDFVHENASC